MARISVSVESYLLFQTPKVINQNFGEKMIKDREKEWGRSGRDIKEIDTQELQMVFA